MFFRLRPEPAVHLTPFQRLAPARERFEGIAFSATGTMAVATSDSDVVLLFERLADGRYADVPYRRIGGPQSAIKYPHDVSFAKVDGVELMAVAQRGGAIAIFAKKAGEKDFGEAPVFEIKGADARLDFSDGVAFVPPDNRLLAACNLTRGTVTFSRLHSLSPVRFDTVPEFELRHWRIFHPDGLAFSNCGGWLGLANHGNHTVAIFERTGGSASRYGPRPAALIRDRYLRYPHSVAFTEDGQSLLVTNAGANYVNVYRQETGFFGKRWVRTGRTVAGPEKTFRKVNAQNKMEGGPKGIAIYGDTVAICSPEFGIALYKRGDAA